MNRVESELSAAKRELLESYLRQKLPQAPISSAIRGAVKPAGSPSSADPRVSLVTVQAGGSKRPFFYFHVHWQGGAYYCFNVVRVLGRDQPFYVFDPYRFDDLPTPPTVERMAADYLAAIRRIQPEGPYLLGAFCGAAPIAYEIAQQLRREGQSVDLLAFIDPMAGSLDFTRLVRRLLRRIGPVLRITPSRQLDWFLRLRYLARVLRGAHDEYTEYGDRLIREWNEKHPRRFRLLPDSGALRQDWLGSFIWVLAAYAPQPYPGKATYLYARDNPNDRKLWWGTVRQAGAGVDIRLIPGDHVTCRTKHLDDLAEDLRTCLNEAQTMAPAGSLSSLAS